MPSLTDRSDEQLKDFSGIDTPEQAIKYLGGLLSDVRRLRLEVDILDQTAATIQTSPMPSSHTGATAQEMRTVQKRKSRELLIRYGRALGSLTTLMLCHRIDTAAYQRLAVEVHGLMDERVLVI